MQDSSSGSQRLKPDTAAASQPDATTQKLYPSHRPKPSAKGGGVIAERGLFVLEKYTDTVLLHEMGQS